MDVAAARSSDDAWGPSVDAAGLRIVVIFGSWVVFGQERGNLDVIDALRSAGADVLLVSNPRDHPIMQRGIGPELDARGLRSVSSPHYNVWYNRQPLTALWRVLTGLPRASFVLWRACRREKPSHVYLFNTGFALYFIPALWILKTPLVFRAGDVPTRHNLLWRAAWAFVRARTTQFVAISDYVAGQLIEAGVERDRITVIRNRPPKRKVSARFSAPLPDAPFVVYHGQVAKHKGVGILVEAFRILAEKVPSAHLVIIGRVLAAARDDFAAALKARVEADPVLRNRVHFTGYVEDVRSVLSHARVHAAPSICNEALGNVVLEAKQALLPSVIFRRGGLPEMVRDGVDGTVCETETSEALAAALAPYLEDADMARQCGERAFQSLETLTSGFTERWLRVLNAATESARVGAHR